MNADANKEGIDGLTTQEAELRLKKFGKNVFSLEERNTFLKSFIHSICEPMMLVLIGSSIVAFIVAFLSNLSAGPQEPVWQNFLNPMLIIGVAILNTAFTVTSELRSQRSIGLLKKMSVVKTSVKRDGHVMEIDSTEVVVGDIILLREGNQIPADALLIEANDLFTNESVLTGESRLVAKAALHGQVVLAKNQLFAGCFVVKGTGIARITAIGFDSELGKVHQLIATQKRPKSRLQARLTKLSKLLTLLSVSVFLLLFVVQMIIQRDQLAMAKVWANILLNATAFAISVIPESIAVGINIVLFVGINKMARQSAIVKKLDVIEAISHVNVICTDKTGTLTKNQMEVKFLWNSSQSSSPTYQEHFYELIAKAILCTDAHLVTRAEKISEEIGDPTETALLRFGWENKIKKSALLSASPLIKSIPFNSETKTMTTIHQLGQDNYMMIVKGAPERVLAQCTNQTEAQLASKINDQWSSQAFRVLAVAVKTFSAKSVQEISLHATNVDLQLLGLIGLVDPVRSESYQAVDFCHELGIKVCMITGDNLLTAKAIASDLKILQSNDLAINGDELDKLSDEELTAKIADIGVYARVKPQDKLRIVQAWQKQKKVVAMTGDGVNDAPALKGADIGCAMGVGGTDVAKEASSIVLMDDNFSTIASAIQLGKGISQKIQKMVESVLIFSFSSFLIVFIGIGLLAIGYGAKNNANIFNYIQLLWLNLLAHGFLSLVVGFQEVKEYDLINQSPRMSDAKFWLLVLWKSLVVTLFTLFSYILARSILGLSGEATPAAFATFAITIGLNPLNVASRDSIFHCKFRFYKLTYIALLVVIGFTLLFLFVPGLVDIFGFGSVTKNWWVILVGFGLGLGPTAIEEIRKFSVKKYYHH